MKHRCGVSHRSYRTLAKCLWPRSCWVAGTGRYASVAYCRVTTIELHETLESAEKAKATIDRLACGGLCYGSHRIVDLEAV